MYSYQIVIGDLYNNGHGRCENFFVQTNFEKSKVLKLYRDFVKKHGLSFQKLFAEYESRYISNDEFKKLSRIVNINSIRFAFEDNKVTLSAFDCAKLFFEMVKSVDNNFQYKLNECETLNDFSIGYGLY